MIRSIVLVLSCCAPLFGQCSITNVVTTPYASCASGGNSINPPITASFAPAGCALTITMPPPLIGNFVPVGSWLVLAVSPQLLTYPPPLGGCPLPAQPILVAPMFFSMNVRLPPALPPTTIYVHGISHLLEPLSGTSLFVLARDGVRIDLR